MRSAIVKAILLGMAVTATTVVGCSSQSSKPGSSESEHIGDLGLELSLGGGISVSTVSYSITGPHSYSGTINVADSSTLSAVIGGILAGNGYVLTLTATSVDGTTTCAGTSAPFNVTARTTTAVAVHLQCNRPRNFGSVLVNGQVNACPVIESVSASPAQGNTIAVASTASDTDNGPSALSYAWTTSQGSLSSANTASTVLSCASAGTATLTLTVSDGDTGANCPDVFTLTVTCPEGGSTGTGGSTGAGGSTGTGGSTETGGSTGTGGSTETGGSTGTGGAATGGSTGTGGAPPPPPCVTSGPSSSNTACGACEADPDNGCPDFVGLCESSFTGASTANCNAVLDCVRNSNCAVNKTTDCYCGPSTTASACAAGQGNGACKAAIEVGAGTTDPNTILANLTNVGTPTGSAMSLIFCDEQACPSACMPYCK